MIKPEKNHRENISGTTTNHSFVHDVHALAESGVQQNAGLQYIKENCFQGWIWNENTGEETRGVAASLQHANDKTTGQQKKKKEKNFVKYREVKYRKMILYL